MPRKNSKNLPPYGLSRETMFARAQATAEMKKRNREAWRKSWGQRLQARAKMLGREGGRPKGSKQSPETRAKIAATMRKRWAAGQYDHRCKPQSSRSRRNPSSRDYRRKHGPPKS
jgi:hypothetical protein